MKKLKLKLLSYEGLKGKIHILLLHYSFSKKTILKSKQKCHLEKLEISSI